MSGHAHAPATATGRHRRRLVVVLCLTAGVVVVQVVGGLLSGSLALLAVAGHMLLDATGVGIALLAAALATRPATDARTFGLLRDDLDAAGLDDLMRRFTVARRPAHYGADEARRFLDWIVDELRTPEVRAAAESDRAAIDLACAA